MNTRLITILLVSVFVLAGCASPMAQETISTAIPTQQVTVLADEATQPSATPTPEGIPVTQVNDLTGVWEITTHPHYPLAYWLVMENGTFKYAPDPDGSGPSNSGKYALENEIFLISDDFCSGDGQYSARRLGDGDKAMLIFTLIEDEDCPSRVKILTDAPAKLFSKEIALVPTAKPTATFASTPVPLEVMENIDIPYTSERNLDVFAPQHAGKWPVVVILHGGGLTKTAVKGLGRTLAGRGTVAFTPTWHSTESTVINDQGQPVGFEDVACAVRFARARAAEYGGDTSRIVVVGHSAGGASGAAIMLAGDDFHGDCLVDEGSALPDAFVGLDGAYELPKYTSPSTIAKTSPEAWAVVNPYIYVDRQPIRQGVEFYINAGMEQELVEDGMHLAEVLQAAGYVVRIREFPGTDHMTMATSRPDLVQMIMEAVTSSDSLQPTLIMGENGCTYSGPIELGTTFTLTWMVEDMESSGYIYSIATLDEGKRIDDIASMPAENPMPEWFNSIRIDFSLSPGAFTKLIDLKANSLFEGGPIYFVCFLSDAELAVGAAGPVEIK